MRSDCRGVFALFPLLFFSLLAAPPPLRAVPADITYETSAFEPHWTPQPSLLQKIPRRPDASPSQESHEVVDIGTVILRKANLVLDRLISAGERTRGLKVDKHITWGNINYEPRLTEQREQIAKHPAFDVIGRTFRFRAVYRLASKSEKDRMDEILGKQPDEIVQTISRIDRLCDIVFHGDAKNPAVEQKILQETQWFQERFDGIFDAVHSEQIEEMILKETNSKMMIPSITIQNFHEKLAAIEELNQKTSILKLHRKLDQAIGRYYNSVRYDQPIKQWDQDKQSIEEWDQKALISSLYPKLDALFRQLAIERGYYLGQYHPPSAKWDQETLILKLPATLEDVYRGQHSYLQYFPVGYDPSIKNWDQEALIANFHIKLDEALSKLRINEEPDSAQKSDWKRIFDCLAWLI
ncbi:hypothetical protein PGT21_029166 [Puccinia graminis f. sp. tritici]|uniref:Uncharacterized protein n=1 Tax=Puccinia graminis f. sp. tritici TaxID=56615 RepID=A0A5B0N5J3_PUCGR|nr:hypothetical protein PGT21_029166 [Puccinia graminis f. sp. tritici]KAA1133030.1 hypothetical protein PGTUg99_024529 [Puccinia graminis f. sp. tritici]